eukprot:COSAG02_NODE_1235_length_13736_cov_12.313265_9_plen_108_part_00
MEHDQFNETCVKNGGETPRLRCFLQPSCDEATISSHNLCSVPSASLTISLLSLSRARASGNTFVPPLLRIETTLESLTDRLYSALQPAYVTTFVACPRQARRYRFYR